MSLKVGYILHLAEDARPLVSRKVIHGPEVSPQRMKLGFASGKVLCEQKCFKRVCECNLGVPVANVM